MSGIILARMEVRPVRPPEFEEAGRVTAGAYREHVTKEWDEDWAAYLEEIADVAGRSGKSTVLVAIGEDGSVLGTATVELDELITEGEPPLAPHEGRLRMLGVDPSARGRGVGQALLDATIAVARDRGRTRLILNTTNAMVSAQRLYERNGFVREDDFVFDNGFGMRSYSLELTGD
jgi:ribosomal protein S18 acetylase RimI-like enzyme